MRLSTAGYSRQKVEMSWADCTYLGSNMHSATLICHQFTRLENLCVPIAGVDFRSLALVFHLQYAKVLMDALPKVTCS